MWQTHPYSYLVQAALKTSFADFFLWVAAHSTNEEKETICASIWASWHNRNREIMEGKHDNITQQSTTFVKMVKDYQDYNSKVHVNRINPSIDQYVSELVPPNEGWIKINFDAHVGNIMERSLGVVARDYNGKIMFTGTRKCTTMWDVETSELAAAYGLELAQHFDVNHVHLEDDAMTVIQSIQKRVQGIASIHLLYEYLHNISLSFNGFSCSFVRRGGNTVAHMIARWDTGFVNEKIWMELYSSNLRAMVALDLI